MKRTTFRVLVAPRALVFLAIAAGGFAYYLRHIRPTLVQARQALAEASPADRAVLVMRLLHLGVSSARTRREMRSGMSAVPAT